MKDTSSFPAGKEDVCAFGIPMAYLSRLQQLHVLASFSPRHFVHAFRTVQWTSLMKCWVQCNSAAIKHSNKIMEPQHSWVVWRGEHLASKFNRPPARMGKKSSLRIRVSRQVDVQVFAFADLQF